jgi:hypothetical protein
VTELAVDPVVVSVAALPAELAEERVAALPAELAEERVAALPAELAEERVAALPAELAEERVAALVVWVAAGPVPVACNLLSRSHPLSWNNQQQQARSKGENSDQKQRTAQVSM